MEHAIRFRCYPLLSPPSHLSYVSKGYHRFNHTSLCLRLSCVSTSHPVARPFRHVNCMLNSSSMPSKNIEGGSDNKILRGVTRVSLVLSCILGLFNFSGKMNPKLNTAYAAFPPVNLKLNAADAVQPDLMAGEEEVFRSFWTKTIIGESIDPKFDPSSKASLDAKKIRIKLKELEDEYKKPIGPESKRNLLRKLIELLIIQGNFEEARKHIDDQIHENYPELVSHKKKIEMLEDSYVKADLYYEKKSIADILLYKAIIHTMLKHEEAAEWWKAFAKTLTENE